MFKIFGKRQTRKTRKLLEISAEHQIPILTKTVNDVINLQIYAKKLDLIIPDPIPLGIFISDNAFREKHITNILIDDADFILAEIIKDKFGHSLYGHTICTDDGGNIYSTDDGSDKVEVESKVMEFNKPNGNERIYSSEAVGEEFASKDLTMGGDIY